jgi:hypothetical protein
MVHCTNGQGFRTMQTAVVKRLNLMRIAVVWTIGTIARDSART